MAIGTPKPSPLLLILILVITTLPPSHSYSLPNPTTSFHSLFSLSHSLLTRVANLRAARGDISGSIRVRSIAQKIEKHSHGFSFYGITWSAGWDYLKNYAWRDLGMWGYLNELIFGLNELIFGLNELILGLNELIKGLNELIRGLNELIKGLNELSRLESEVERVAWVGRNYGSVLKVSKSLLNRLLKMFTQSCALKDAVEMVRTEIVDGGLLRDCLELGSTDLKGVVQILKDVASHYSSTSTKKELRDQTIQQLPNSPSRYS